MVDDSNGGREEPRKKRRKKKASIRIVVDDVPERSIVAETVSAAAPPVDAGDDRTAVDVRLPEVPASNPEDESAGQFADGLADTTVDSGAESPPAGPDSDVSRAGDTAEATKPVHETVHVSDIPPSVLAGDIQDATTPASRAGFDDVTEELSISEIDASEVSQIQEALAEERAREANESEETEGTNADSASTATKGGAPPPPPPEPVASASKPEAPPFPELGERERPWFESFFSDDYLRTVPPPPEKYVARQCDFIEETLKLEKGATVLDVGCGLGLHAIELAARGYLVVGLDLSLPMLSRAGDEAQDRGVKINFLHGDMREMTFDGAFDAVLCWGTTFGYFEDDANKRVIKRLFQALKPKGRALIDVVNRDYVVRNQPNLVWFEGDGCVCMEETNFNYITARLEVKRTVILDDNKQRESHYSIRLYALHELGQLLHARGFRVAAVSGHEALSGVFFGADSSRMIVLAERRGPDDRPSRLHERPPPPPSNGAEGGKKKNGDQPPPVPPADSE